MARLMKSMVIGLGLISSLAIVNAAESGTESSFEDRKKAIQDGFAQDGERIDAEFASAKKAYLDAFEDAKKQLGKIWDDPELSDKQKWVQYADNDTTKRTVDFESGEIVVEIVGDNKSAEQIDKIVKQQVKELETQTTEQAFKKDKVLSKVDAKPQKVEAKQKVLPKLNTIELRNTAQKTEHTQKNGVKVTRVTMAVPKNKIAQRAMIYLPKVNETAQKWNIRPELILAIMHTESHFNPMAQSHIPAYGLMQVVPSSAGRDVTKVYLGKEQVLTPDILFNPDMNIDIGTAYINVLFTRYLKNVKDEDAKTYLAISSYNGGVGAVAKHFTGKGSLSGLAKKANTLQPDFIYNSLVKEFPYKETRNYLKKVNDKKNYYAKMLKASKI